MASHYESQRYTVTKLNNTNYFQWKFSIEMLLLKEGVWRIIVEEDPEEISEGWTKMNNSARATIALSVEPEMHELIRECETAKSMWNKIKKHFERVGLSTKVFIRRKLSELKLDNCSGMENYITRVMEFVRRLRSAGDKITDIDVIATILCGLPESYDGLIMALESKDEKELSLEYIQMKLIDENERRNEKHTSQNLFNSQFATRHDENRYERKCYECGKTGHIRRYCPTPSRQYYGDSERPRNTRVDQINDTQNNRQRDNTAYQADYSTRDNKFFSFAANYPTSYDETKGNYGTTKWIIDSGANFHMCSDKSYYSEFTDFESENSVEVANGLNIQAIGKGTINLALIQDDTQINIELKDVICAPELSVNLMSINQICNQGFNVRFKGDTCQIINQAKESFFIYKTDGLYMTEFSSNRTNEARANKTCIHEWHKLLGHRSIEKIRKMSQNNMTNNLKIKPCNHNDNCASCDEAAMIQIPFKEVKHEQSNGPFQLIHSDLCGPIAPTSKGGGNYFLTFTDDWSRYCQIAIIKNKSDVTNEVKKYMEHNHNQFKCYPKYFRSDGGGEYENFELNRYLESVGTKHQISVPFSPQQNGVSERINRTLIRMAKTMMQDSNIPRPFWGELLNTSCYLYNRNLHSHTGCTPFERWEDRKPNLQHLKVIGQEVFYWVPRQNRSKLENSAKPGIIVGYGDRQKAYRVWDPKLGKIIFSRNIRENKDSVLELNIWETEPRDDQCTMEIRNPTYDETGSTDRLRRSTRSNLGVPPVRYRQ